MTADPPLQIAAAVLRRADGKVLLLKRAPSHTTNPNLWCFVTGYVEVGEQPFEAAVRELQEELGFTGVPTRAGDIVVVNLPDGRRLQVYPFLFETNDFPVVLDREHTEYAWIAPPELYHYDFVQQLDEDLVALGLL